MIPNNYFLSAGNFRVMQENWFLMGGCRVPIGGTDVFMRENGFVVQKSGWNGRGAIRVIHKI